MGIVVVVGVKVVIVVVGVTVIIINIVVEEFCDTKNIERKWKYRVLSCNYLWKRLNNCMKK